LQCTKLNNALRSERGEQKATRGNIMKKKLAMSMVVALLAFTAAAGADYKTDDMAIQAAVEQKLAHKDISNGNGPWVEVVNGTVTLSGKVKSVWAKNEAIKRALGVKSVQAVEDELEIAFGESDKKVAEDITNSILRYAYYTVYDEVGLEVDEGHVTLMGRVTMPFKADEIEKRASKVFGVQSVNAQITTLPVNIGDERLRRALTRRIYGDLLFMDYARHVNPPIHIVVERGRVTLSGAVRSEVERVKAGQIARTTFGVFSVENKLKVD
jgi:hyperosmotically inducible protein